MLPEPSHQRRHQLRNGVLTPFQGCGSAATSRSRSSPARARRPCSCASRSGQVALWGPPVEQSEAEGKMGINVGDRVRTKRELPGGFFGPDRVGKREAGTVYGISF